MTTANGRASRQIAAPRPAVFRAKLLLGAVALAAALVGLRGSPLLLTLLTQAAINAMLATSVGFMIRQTGLVSFGHAAFFGLGAYAAALLTARAPLPAECSMLLAVLAPAALAFLLGLAFLRIGGIAFSMLTLALAQAVYELVLHWRSLANGEDGMAMPLPTRLFGLDSAVFQQAATMLPICAALLAALLLALAMLARSCFGTLTLAIRDNEERARFIGYETLLPRAGIYAASAAAAAAAGVLFAVYNGFVTPNILYWGLSGEALVMAVIGGTRAIWGAALGAMVFFLLKDVAGDLTEHWQAIIGGTLILVAVLLPQGASGLLAGRRAR